MPSPAALALIHRLIALLHALIAAIPASAEGKPNPVLSRLAARAAAAYIERIAAELTEAADAAASTDLAVITAPAPTPASEAPSPHQAAATPAFVEPNARRPLPRRPPRPSAHRSAPVPTHAQFITIP